MSFEDTFEEVAQSLAEQLPGVERAKIMHSAGLRVNGKFFAFARAGRLVVKLPAERVTVLRDRGEGQPFESGGRVMREWVQLEPRGFESTLSLVTEAGAFVASLRTGAQ
jgi:hypothetical protein